VATIATTTNSTPFIYPATRLLDRDPVTGNLFAMVKSSTANQYDLYWSADGGGSWGLWASFSRASIQELGPIFIGNNQILFTCYRTSESSQDRIYVKTINLGAATPWDGETLISFPSNGGVAGGVYTGMDFGIVVASNGYYMPIAVGTTSGSTHGVTVLPVFFPITTGVPYYAPFWAGTKTWFVTGSGRITPGVDIEHNADGKSATTPNLWITFGRSKLMLVKCPWTPGAYTGPASANELVSSITATDQIPGRWDGTRFLMAVPSGSTVKVYERNRANSSTTTRTSPTHTTGVVRHCTVNYDSTSGNMRVYAVGTSTAVWYYVDFVRSTGVWGSWATVSASAILGVNNFGVKHSTYGDAKHHVYYAVSGSPNTLTNVAQSIPYSPNTPTWVSPTGGQAQDVAAGLTLDWAFSDPDPNDVQSAYALQRQIGSGSLNYYTASGNTWGTTEVFNSTATTQVTVPANTWGNGADANHTYKVKTRDSTALDSGYSAGLVVVPSAKVNPSFTAPASGGIVTSATVTVTWTVSEQTAYQVKLLTNPGGATMYDSGKVVSTSTTHTPTLVLADGSGWTINLTTWNNEGLASTVQTRSFSVDYITPMVPTLVATAVPASGYITVAITNPTPSGGAPAVASQDLWRRKTGDSTSAVRIATGLASGASYNDWGAWSGQAFDYQAVVTGTNGTSSSSAWTA
jgi:hypothetical protein